MLATAVFVVIVTLSGTKLADVSLVAAILFVMMVVFGWLFDKWFYQLRLRRWHAKRAASGRRPG